MVKNPPSNAREAGLIPGQGTKVPHAVGQLSPCPVTREAWALQRRPSAAKKKFLFLSQLMLTISLRHHVHGLPSVYSAVSLHRRVYFSTVSQTPCKKAP